MFNGKFKPIKKCTLIRSNYALVSTAFAVITKNQLESARRYVSRRLGKKAKKIMRIRLNCSFFKKPEKSRMGKGSGKFYRSVGYVQPGSVLYEFKGPLNRLRGVKSSFRTLGSKMPFKCRVKFKPLIFKF